MRKIAILTATTVLVLTGGSTAVAFAAGSDDGPAHHRATARATAAGDDHRGRRAEAGDDHGRHRARHHDRHHDRHDDARHDDARHHARHHARHRHVEPGDNRGGTTRHVEPGDDHGGRHGGHGSDD